MYLYVCHSYHCGACGGFIVGTRVHCLECDNFDLCLGCYNASSTPLRFPFWLCILTGLFRCWLGDGTRVQPVKTYYNNRFSFGGYLPSWLSKNGLYICESVFPCIWYTNCTLFMFGCSFALSILKADIQNCRMKRKWHFSWVAWECRYKNWTCSMYTISHKTGTNIYSSVTSSKINRFWCCFHPLQHSNLSQMFILYSVVLQQCVYETEIHDITDP